MYDADYDPKKDPNSFESLTSRADFSWLGVLKDAGAGEYLTGKNGPCPFCPDAGKDRFAVVHKLNGWRCFQCTGGKIRSFSEFLMKWQGYGRFVELADHIRKLYGVLDGEIAAAAPRPRFENIAPKIRKISPDEALARIERIWKDTRAVSAGDPVDVYLRSRLPGLGAIPNEIRVHPALDYWDRPADEGGKPIFVGKFPAMIVRGLDAHGSVVQIHKTYLTSEGVRAPVANVKKTDIGVGCNSFALRLGEPEGDTLGVAEGIETALAATILDGITVWPCYSASVLANFVLPVHLRGKIKRVMIYADSDALKNGKKTGSAAAQALADRLRQERVRSLIVRPAKVATDMADLVATA